MTTVLAPPREAPLRPMLASLDEAPLVDERWGYELKYDGIRALVEVARPTAGGVRIWSRLGNDKTAQFPEIVEALARLARRARAPLLLDGEIVALDATGHPAGFQRLQGRIHRALDEVRERPVPADSVAFVAFDILREGAEDLRSLPLTARRAHLTRILGSAASLRLRLSEFALGDGRALYQACLAQGGEGLVAKYLASPYRAGRRSPDWRKLKIQSTQSCVVGGWTDPRGSRAYFGALLLGLWDSQALRYVGHTGAGFGQAELARVAARLTALETSACPFTPRPQTNEAPHWIEPRLVAEVRFTEWTADGRLRHPTYLGLRDDLEPRAIRRESRTRLPGLPSPQDARRRSRRDGVAPRHLTFPAPARPPAAVPERTDLAARLADLESSAGAGTLALSGGTELQVSGLRRVLWPSTGITKGELMRYYLALSPFLCPTVADRPLVIRRYPRGVEALPVCPRRAPSAIPGGVRVEAVPGDRAGRRWLVGGPLITLLYLVQVAVVSQEPWLARVGSLEFPDHAVIHLDPMPGVAFVRVLDVARWVHDELERLGVQSLAKTSGAGGVHVYVPLRPGTSWEAGRLFAQIVATLVARRHPRNATVEHRVPARGRTVYIDSLQNEPSRGLTAAYSACATPEASVSTPLIWGEVHAGVDHREFTLRTLPARVGRLGDVWAALRTSPGADLDSVLERLRG